MNHESLMARNANLARYYGIYTDINPTLGA